MNLTSQCLLLAALFSLSTGLTPIYASNKVNLVENGTVSLDYITSKGIYVSEAYVYHDGNEMVIYGKVKREYGKSAHAGYVDIEVLDSEGITLNKVTATHVPRIVRRKGAREASFTASLPIIPSKGSTIRLGYCQLAD